MAENTKIEWADDSISFWHGCTKIAPGCTNCYADSMSKRWGLDVWGPKSPRLYIKSAVETMRRLNRKAEKEGRPRMVFVNSMSDVFEDHHGPVVDRNRKAISRGDAGFTGPDAPLRICDLRFRLFELADECEWLRLLILTKRPENVRKMWPAKTNYREMYEDDPYPNANAAAIGLAGPAYYRPTVWLGCSVSEQKTADENIPELLKLRDLCAVLFLSCEPLLGPIDLSHVANMAGEQYGLQDKVIDLVIVGGESGHGARPCSLEWIRSIRDQCQAADVPVFIKQLGSNAEEWDASHRNGTGPFISNTIRDSKGGEMTEWPEDLRVREFPRVEVLS